MFLRLITLAVVIIAFIILVSQVFLPMFNDKEFFWYFKKTKEEEDLTVEEDDDNDPYEALDEDVDDVISRKESLQKTVNNKQKKLNKIDKKLKK